MTKYHLTEIGPKPCKANIRSCPVGGTHFSDPSTAQKEFETGLKKEFGASKGITKTDLNKLLSEQLKTVTPVNIDQELARIYYASSVAEGELQSNLAFIARNTQKMQEHLKKFDDPTHPNYRTYLGSIERLTEKNKVLEQTLLELKAEAKPYNSEFVRRGGWTRAFLVSNGNGHVHSSTACSTCFPTTKYAWMTEYSSKTENEIVTAAGERACTVCYPSAPVEILRRPTLMFTQEEKDAALQREERAKLKEAKAAKAALVAVTTSDGKTLRIKTIYGYHEEVKTERSAVTTGITALVDLKRYAKWANQEIEYDKSDETLTQANLDILIEALARKRGVTEAVVLEELDAKASIKFKLEED